MEGFHTWLSIDLDAFHHNINTYKQFNKEILLVLKANGYGHGDVLLANNASRWGYDKFAVSSFEEAMHLRQNNINGMILILGVINPEKVPEIIDNDISICIPSLSLVEILPEDLTNLKVHLKIDSGMNRIGMKTKEETKEVFEILKKRGANIEGIFTHYAVSDSDKEFTNHQYQVFKDIVESIDYKFPYIHASNSNGIFVVDEPLTNMIRPGIGLYGYGEYFNFKPVMSFYTSLTNVKKIHQGESLGYGLDYTASQDEWIGTIPVGYADGWLRKNQNHYLAINGKKVQHVGRICMDQSMIRLDKEYPLGTTVELFGPTISLLDVANYLDTIPHEILTGLSNRIARIYYENNKIVYVDHGRFNEDYCL